MSFPGFYSGTVRPNHNTPGLSIGNCIHRDLLHFGVCQCSVVSWVHTHNQKHMLKCVGVAGSGLRCAVKPKPVIFWWLYVEHRLFLSKVLCFRSDSLFEMLCNPPKSYKFPCVSLIKCHIHSISLALRLGFSNLNNKLHCGECIKAYACGVVRNLDQIFYTRCFLKHLIDPKVMIIILQLF